MHSENSFNKILVVCLGNICRSPLGEYLLRNKLKNKIIHSAGISAMVDYPAHKYSQEVAAENGLDLSAHQAQQLTKNMIEQYDLILVMEQRQINEVARISASALAKTMLFGQWLPVAEKEIIDPYGHQKDFYKHTFAKMAKAADLWVDKLS